LPVALSGLSGCLASFSGIQQRSLQPTLSRRLRFGRRLTGGELSLQRRFAARALSLFSGSSLRRCADLSRLLGRPALGYADFPSGGDG
jgi:hypothetical protein